MISTILSLFQKKSSPKNPIAREVKTIMYARPEPLPTKPIPDYLYENPTFRDFTGKRIGRFKVMGYAAGRGGRWVVRCECGTYAIRKSSSLNKPHNKNYSCGKCEIIK